MNFARRTSCNRCNTARSEGGDGGGGGGGGKCFKLKVAHHRNEIERFF